MTSFMIFKTSTRNGHQRIWFSRITLVLSLFKSLRSGISRLKKRSLRRVRLSRKKGMSSKGLFYYERVLFRRNLRNISKSVTLGISSNLESLFWEERKRCIVSLQKLRLRLISFHFLRCRSSWKSSRIIISISYNSFTKSRFSIW